MANTNMLLRAPQGVSQLLVRDGSVLQVQASGLFVVDAAIGCVPDLLAIGCVPLDPQSPLALTQVQVNPTFAALPL